MAASSSDAWGDADSGIDSNFESVLWEKTIDEPVGTHQHTRGVPIAPPTVEEAELGLTEILLDKYWRVGGRRRRYV